MFKACGTVGSRYLPIYQKIIIYYFRQHDDENTVKKKKITSKVLNLNFNVAN